MDIIILRWFLLLPTPPPSSLSLADTSEGVEEEAKRADMAIYDAIAAVIIVAVV